MVFTKPLSQVTFDDFKTLMQNKIPENDFLVGREFSTELLESNYSYIASGMMHEAFNHFKSWRCPLFGDKGDYIRQKFAEY